MLCFVLFWLIQFPMALIHPRKLQPLFILKGVTLPIVAIGMTGWCIHKAGDQASAVLREAPRLSGVAHFFAVATALNSCMSTWSTLSVNISDMSRYSKKPSSAALQVVFIPVLWTVCAAFGTISASCTTVIPIYEGKAIFQPFDIIENGGWLASPGGRAAAFFCSAAWAIGNMTTVRHIPLDPILRSPRSARTIRRNRSETSFLFLSLPSPLPPHSLHSLSNVMVADSSFVHLSRTSPQTRSVPPTISQLSSQSGSTFAEAKSLLFYLRSDLFPGKY